MFFLYTDPTSTKWLIQIAASLHGVQPMELFLILTGEQGIGKTRFFRELLPKEISERYVTIKPIFKNKDQECILTHRILYIDDELEGIMKNGAEYLKYLTSADAFDFRDSYGKLNFKRERRAVFGGTSNKDDVLKDSTGNRRFIPIRVLKRNDELYKSIDKYKLFALLVHRWRQNEWEAIRLNDEELEYLNDGASEFLAANFEVEQIEKYFQNIVGDHKNYLRSSDVLVIIKKQTQVNTISLKKVGEALKKLYGEKLNFTRDGKRTKGYPIELRHEYRHDYETLADLAEKNRSRGYNEKDEDGSFVLPF